MLTLFKNISLKDKVLFYESIANLLEGGVTLLAALKGFSSRVPPGNFKEAIENTIFFVEGGDTMNVAMRKVPNFYTQKEIAIVEAGEQTGMLRTTFTAISDELRTEEDLRRKVTSAMIYPFIIVFFLILALIVVMVYVIPQIIPIISETGSELSWSTRSLIFASDFFRDNFILIIALIVSAGFIFRGYITTPSGRKWIDREKLFFPVIGRVYRSYMIVQVMETFHLLTASGVSIVTTLHLTGGSSGNRVIEEMYERMSADISHGKKIFESMQSVDKAGLFFSSDILQMIESAERTSTIKEVSLKISQQYRREVDAALANMVKFIEPLALLFSGTFVLWFAIAIFSAIMQVVSVAGV